MPLKSRRVTVLPAMSVKRDLPALAAAAGCGHKLAELELDRASAAFATPASTSANRTMPTTRRRHAHLIASCSCSDTRAVHDPAKRPADGAAATPPNSLWGGRFAGGPAAIMRRINASIDFDKRLYAEDIAGSQAHCAMLVAQKIIVAGRWRGDRRRV